MKEVLELIEKRKREFAQLPLFKFLQDKNIDPRERLAWAPCLAPFAMGFGQLNKYDFRKEPTNNPIQAIINKHTYEDDNHWGWFLEDIEKLNLNNSMKFSDAMKFFWGEETYKTRQICHQIALHTFQAEPVVVLAAIEAIEATGHVALALTAQVAQELQQDTKQNYRYFGQHHFCVETGHAVGTDNLQQFVENLQLTEEQKTKSFELVEKVFEVFSESMEEMMVYVNKHSLKKLLEVS
ncbi:hypothetical protein NIES2100_64650 [Calothrix sp. NIES-2100]|uniref:hypothetical protein n=1 Tax=Calothrix sp. NIES-2100 TaxID=1954172 RepID=UPI000B5FF6A6|nr:hypothetical protein NIES2100_64650 [Calothrix sp. NIES-2100]